LARRRVYQQICLEAYLLEAYQQVSSVHVTRGAPEAGWRERPQTTQGVMKLEHFGQQKVSKRACRGHQTVHVWMKERALERYREGT
jgi:hypothetical protein